MATRNARKSRQPRKSREAWIEAAVEVLAEGGVEAVRVEPLARRLGVTKGSFYWHFQDRADLLAALVQTWADVGTEEIIRRVEAEGGDAPARLRRLWAVSSEDALEPEMAIRDWARRDPEVEARVCEVDTRRLAYLRSLFASPERPRAEVEARCMLLYSLLIGNSLIHGSHGRLGRARVLDEALRLLLDD